MKITFLIALLIIPAFCISQKKKPVTGFLGIKFGSSKAQVIAALKAKNCSILKYGQSDDVNFAKLKLAGRLSDTSWFIFKKKKIYKGEVHFKVASDAEAIAFRDSLVKFFSATYGPGRLLRYTWSQSRRAVINIPPPPATDTLSQQLKTPPPVPVERPVIGTQWETGYRFIEVYFNHDFTVTVFYIDDNL